MTVEDLLRTLAGVPVPSPLPPIAEELVASSVAYLASEVAIESLEANVYWPKWDSPWWHMLLLLELDEAGRIPARVVDTMVTRLDAMPLHIFPIHAHELPSGTNPSLDVSCHCALGAIHQVLTACGVDVARALPWVEPWFERYQMPDGGANCDETAYLAAECASSMVATIAPFEAMLARPPSAFADRAAAFLIERQLTHGSPSRHNADEREAAPSWLYVCFPRFYFYDVLRGFCALVKWATAHERTVPVEAVAGTAAHLGAAFPDGVVRVQRQAFAGKGSLVRVGGEWKRQQTTTSFPLLEGTGVIGEPSAILTRRWATARQQLVALIELGRVSLSPRTGQGRSPQHGPHCNGGPTAQGSSRGAANAPRELP